MKIVEVNKIGYRTTVVMDEIKDNEVRSRNFKGEEKRSRETGRVVNTAGRRNFLLYLDETAAEQLKTLGCEVKYTTPRDDNDVARPYVSINVSWFMKPVEAHMISASTGVDTPLDEVHVGILDNAEFKNLGLVLEVGKEKTHQNGTVYNPLFASQIWAEVVPSYFADRYANMNSENTPF